MKKIVILLSLFTLGCSPISPYKEPDVYAPQKWKKETNPEIEMEMVRDSSYFENWWLIFNDPVLNDLEAVGLKNNQTLKVAIQNYMQAKANAEIARAQLFPSIFFSPNFYKQEGVLGGGLSNFNNGLNGNIPNGLTSSQPDVLRAVIGQYTVPFNVNYQVDLWNQIRNGYDAALFTEEAALEGFNALILSITSDIAENYFILRSLDSEREVLVESQIIRKNAVEINRARYDAGLVNYTDVSRAITEYADVNADYEDMLRQRNIQENILAALMGIPAPEFSVDYSPLHIEPPFIPAGIPATIISKRPDIREKERLLAASWANIAVAYADYLPSLNLAGSIGYSTPIWSNLLDWQSRFWSYTISIAQMVFDGGAITGNVRLAKAEYLENLANYRENVLIAFQEVEDALAGIKYRQTQGIYLVEAVDGAKDTLNLSQERYDRGLVTYLDVVDAERTLLDSQRSYVRVFGSRYVSTVQLIRSLGGSF
jgi:multidrug efflux system outer membrane protein